MPQILARVTRDEIAIAVARYLLAEMKWTVQPKCINFQFDDDGDVEGAEFETTNLPTERKEPVEPPRDEPTRVTQTLYRLREVGVDGVMRAILDSREPGEILHAIDWRRKLAHKQALDFLGGQTPGDSVNLTTANGDVKYVLSRTV